MLFSFIKTIIISVIIIFLIQQIYSFLVSTATQPKIKLPCIEKYKCIMDEIAAKKRTRGGGGGGGNTHHHHTPHARPPSPVASIKDITDDDDIFDFNDNDNESVISDGFTLLREQMEDDLKQLVDASLT
jgi:hypothetical protein